MAKIEELKIVSKSKEYTLIIKEYMGMKKLKYMINFELHGDKTVTTFLMGIPDPILIYANDTNRSQETVVKSVYQLAIDSVRSFIEIGEWTEGKTYYGEYMGKDFFVITDKKPDWEDGYWGEKI